MSTTKRHAGRPAWVPPPNIDWTRPASKIAQDCGVCVHTVLRAMRLAGAAIRPRGVPKGTLWEQQKRTQGQPRRADPGKFDWRHQDVHLGELHGLTRERVRQVRKEIGAPASGSAEWLAAGGIVTRPQHQGRRAKTPKTAKTKALESWESMKSVWETLGSDESNPLLLELINENVARLAVRIAEIKAKPDNWRPRPSQSALARQAKRASVGNGA